jgi:hypothetical protein
MKAITHIPAQAIAAYATMLQVISNNTAGRVANEKPSSNGNSQAIMTASASELTMEKTVTCQKLIERGVGGS